MWGPLKVSIKTCAAKWLDSTWNTTSHSAPLPSSGLIGSLADAARSASTSSYWEVDWQECSLKMAEHRDRESSLCWSSLALCLNLSHLSSFNSWLADTYSPIFLAHTHTYSLPPKLTCSPHHPFPSRTHTFCTHTQLTKPSLFKLHTRCAVICLSFCAAFSGE